MPWSGKVTIRLTILGFIVMFSRRTCLPCWLLMTSTRCFFRLGPQRPSALPRAVSCPCPRPPHVWFVPCPAWRRLCAMSCRQRSQRPRLPVSAVFGLVLPRFACGRGGSGGGWCVSLCVCAFVRLFCFSLTLADLVVVSVFCVCVCVCFCLGLVSPFVFAVGRSVRHSFRECKYSQV